jgi:NADPH:quinone reductase-like Zn-dependent oxidoreductase
MRAYRYHRYGPPEVLSLEEVPAPSPAANEVLLRVRAASVNPYDWHFLRGEPYLLRLMAGLRAPKDTRLGTDVSGIIECAGPAVTRFRPGDEVFGTCKGAFAELACAPESSLVAKPPHLSFQAAAAVPIAALTALESFRKAGLTADSPEGMQVLINGASGGVGTFAVQLAKVFGAHVTGVCSTRNVELVRSLGANDVVDYKKRDFTANRQRFDIFLDNVGNRSLLACRRLLKPNGRYVVVGGSAGRWMAGAIARTIAQLALSAFGSRKFLSIFGKVTHDDLASLAGLLASSRIVPTLDRTYALGQLPAAIAYVESGHASGKVVVTVP